ncbi:sulfatase [Elizabethkingia anophelis]|uniref:Sulfatase n=2 Tax=Elizabethkingia anophelis TaxID=1117645 RepID=A0AAE4T5N5_9FLAO|nr:sulfatase [Elizabethkingia anophelis]MDV3866058.1 sulfatase [Elizabethkingia anophelis]
MHMKFTFILLFSCFLGSNVLAQKPNIIWITCEDISPYIGAFGDKVISTPNIDALAKDGVKYTSVYTVAGVCSPSRSGIITGMYPTSIGTQHMRTKAVDARFHGEGIPNYSAVLPEYVKAFPEYLRKEGYYTSNNQKEDYQFQTPVTVWDESSPAADYKNRKEGQPFFSIYNFFITHESQVMKYADTLTVKPQDVKIPEYYENTPTTKKDIANLFTRIETMDKQVGELIKRLKKEGLYENTYIFFFSDHGGNLPWMKREVLERGTHIPFIVKFPQKKNAGTEVKNLISSIDFAPSVLSLAGIQPPKYFQGQAFLGKYATNKTRKYVFAARDRMDEKYDRVRAVRDHQYRYIYNYMPNQPKYQDLAYRKEIPMMKEILEKRDKNEIKNPYLLEWFKPTKPVEELYDVINDPDEVHNLAGNQKYAVKLKELRTAFRAWEKEAGDMSSIPEKEMVIDRWWNGKDEAPLTATPVVVKKDNGVIIECGTKGASIGYRILKPEEKDQKIKRIIHTWDMGIYFGFAKNGNTVEVNPSWNVYKGNVIQLKKGERLIVNAMRIGYEPSQTEYIQP